jgi:hypothetical protein
MSRTMPVGSYGLGTNFPNWLAAPSNSGFPEQISTGISGYLARTRSASEPVENARCLDVGEHQIDPLAGLDELHRGIGACSLDYLKACVPKCRGNVHPDEKLIFNEQDSARTPIELLSGNHSQDGPPYRKVNGVSDAFVPGQPDWDSGSLHLRLPTTLRRPRRNAGHGPSSAPVYCEDYRCAHYVKDQPGAVAGPYSVVAS